MQADMQATGKLTDNPIFFLMTPIAIYPQKAYPTFSGALSNRHASVAASLAPTVGSESIVSASSVAVCCFW